MLADPFQLEGEAAGAAWQRPDVPPETAQLRAAIGELDRGLKATRPDYLTWICQKLGAMPTQHGDGLNAAIWADNVHDVCGHYPEDLLQAACLELLRTKTFRPQPAEIVAVIEPKYAERLRMVDRCKAMLAPKAAVGSETGNPASKILTEAGRIKAIQADIERHSADGTNPGQASNWAHAERALAFLTKKPMPAWVWQFFEDERIAKGADVLPTRSAAVAARRVVADVAPADLGADPSPVPPPWDAIAEGDDYGQAAG